MRKLKVRKADKNARLCRRIVEANDNKQTPKGAGRRIPDANAPITIRLNQILLAMGYDSSLVEMLGRRYRV